MVFWENCDSNIIIEFCGLRIEIFGSVPNEKENPQFILGVHIRGFVNNTAITKPSFSI